MRIITLGIVSFFWLSFACFANDTIAIKPGAQTEFYSKEKTIIRAAMGNPSIATLDVLGKNKLLISGQAIGETTLLLWYRNQSEPERHTVVVSSGSVALTNIQVQTDIKVVEISKTALKEAGFFFGKQTGNTTIGIGNSSAVNGFGDGSLFSNNGFLPFSDAFNVIIGDASKGILGTISALNANGFAYTLAEPSLVTMSGHTATFLAGGEFPYPKSSNDGDITIDFKEFGVRLHLSPTVLEDERILLKVAPEVSELNYNQGVTTAGIIVPGISVRRTDTTVQLGNGESFVISGLISSNTMKNSDHFPGLGDIPILGAFFRSSRLEQNDKELMMVVTPHLVKPLAKDAKLPTLPGEVYRRYNPNFFELIFLNQEPEDLPVGIGFSEGL
nr:pilus assembly protein N-terminal domain-containing protein [uncultured Vibrio sp.]